MATSLLDLRPLMSHLYTAHVSTVSTEAELQQLADDISASQAILSKGLASVSISGLGPFVFTTKAIPGVVTLDGVLVTDYSLFLRDFLFSLLAPSLGQKPTQDPLVLADLVRTATLRFFSGGSTGGAVYDSGHWAISPAWVATAAPQPVAAISSSIDSPVARTLDTLFGKGIDDQRDLQKALANALDPNFSMLAVAGSTMISVNLAQSVRRHAQDVADWKPTLVASSDPTATDVVTRPGTFVPSPSYADWRSDAFDQLLTSGYLLASLQLPRLWSHPSMLYRLSWDGSGLCWFTGTSADYQVAGITQARVTDMLANPLAYKLGWLDSLRGVPLPDAVSCTAFMSSPLSYASLIADFNSVSNVSVPPSLQLTSNRRAWIRSDPSVSASGLWLANTLRPSIPKPWVDAIDPTLFQTLQNIN